MDADPRTTLEEKRLAPAAADRALTKALRGRRGRLTKADAVAASGLPTHVVDESLDRLLKRYRSHLAVTEEGELLYEFDPSLRRRDEPTFGERLAAVGRQLARAGMWLFKAWIAVTLVVYVIVFVVLLIGAMFGGRRDDRRGGGWGDHHGHGGGHGHGMSWMWWLFWPRWGWGGGWGHHRHDPWGRPVPPPAGTARRGGKERKPFLQAIYDFVFGPARPAPDSLADEREILELLRARDGRLVATDLVALHGWSYRRAEEEATRLMVDYDGEPEITEEGVIVYAFPGLLRSAEAEAPSAERVPRAWERLETRPVLTGNRRGVDLAIAGFAGFNLFASLFAADWARASYGVTGPAWDFALTAFPLAFFALFLAVPALRAVARRLGDAGRERRNRRRRLVKDVLRTRGGPLPDGPGLRDLALALEGEPDFEPGSGAVVYRFHRVAEELAAMERHRAGLDVEAERRLGPVIFGSDDEGERALPPPADEPEGRRPRD